jgi:polar amino acid transport system substrate-binding protein
MVDGFSRRKVTGLLLSSPLILANTPLPRSLLRFAYSNGSPPRSFEVDGKCAGIIPDLVKMVVIEGLLAGYNCRSFPWARAQEMVKRGDYDGLCTYPSVGRQKYAHFTQKPVYQSEFGYLIYHKNNTKMAGMADVKSFEDLRDFTFLATKSVGWEEDNIPDYVPRRFLVGAEAMFNVIFRRQFPGFVIMQVEEAMYYAGLIGAEKQLGYVRAKFIPNSLVDYHIGLQKSLPASEKIVSDMSEFIKSDLFLARREEILTRYRMSS